jgi:hypothetical protein
MKKNRKVILFFILTFLLSSCSDMLRIYTGPEPSKKNIETRGKEFFVAFQEIYDQHMLGPPDVSLYITGEYNAEGQVSIAGLNFTQSFSVNANKVTRVVLPLNVRVCSNDLVENLGVHITASEPVAVYGINREIYLTDSFLAYPVTSCGKEYYVMSYHGSGFAGSNFTIVGINDNSSIEITPAISTGTRQAGVPYAITLNSGQTYLLFDTSGQSDSTGDVTGTHIVSDKAIAVLSGHKLCNVPSNTSAEDHLVEQILPVSSWDSRYLLLPFFNRTKDTVRILAAFDNTTVSFNQSVAATLNAGEYIDELVTQNTVISADHPILAAQFAHGAADNPALQIGDPFMLMVPSTAQYRTSYTFCTLHSEITNNYIHIIVPTKAVADILLDGSPIVGVLFSTIDETYSGARVPVIMDTHNITCSHKFGLILYGFGTYESYGNAGG